MEDELRGVAFPEDGTTGRSTSRLGRAVVADALREVDPVGAQSAEREADWRGGYLVHFRRLVEAGLLSRQAALTIARAGLRSLQDRMRVVHPDGSEAGLETLFERSPERRLRATTVAGTAAPSREVSVPVRGERLSGTALDAQLDRWVADGVVEPTCAEVVRRVRDNPDWLSLDGRRVVVLGAGAEMGPLPSLLRWGADVIAVDLPAPQIWRRLTDLAAASAGRLHVPVSAGDDAAPGADLLTEAAAVADWLLGLGDGALVLGNYVYADGATNLRLAVAVDALTEHIRGRRRDTSIAGLATPTDVFAVPRDAVEHSSRAYAERSTGGKLLARPLRMLSAGRLLKRAYGPGVDPGINDSLVPQQGPNYALAKRVHRWRAAVARDEGVPVSFHVAPPTRTRSVVKNRALAAAYAGAHRFGVEVFEPDTSNTLMALLLVHDLQHGQPTLAHPWQDEAFAAAHGGLWRAAYEPRSVLGLAAVLGLGAART